MWTLFKKSRLAAVLLSLVAAMAAQDMGVVVGNAGTVQISGPASSERQPTGKTGSVSGQALYEDTGKPVRHARIVLMEEHGQSAAFGVTDRSGKFHISKVAEGNYFVDVESPGCISAVSTFKAAELDQASTADLSRLKDDYLQIKVEAGQDSNIPAQCRRGGAISGTVFYEDGAPAPDVQVNIFRRSDSGTQQVISGLSLSALTGNKTDDRGRFRISGLASGEYVISALEPSAQGDSEQLFAASFMGRGGIAQIYYGDVTSIKEAKSLKIGVGEEIPDADIHLLARKLHAISGIVVFRDDQHVVSRAAVELRMKSGDKDSVASTVTNSDDEGKFVFDDMPDGAYTIAVQPGFDIRELEQKTRHPDSLKGYEGISREVTVQGQNLESVKLEVKGNQKKLPQAAADQQKLQPEPPDDNL
jgi:Carboxypeptidase regulatory-like domain